MVIADETHARVAQFFVCEDLGPREIRGLTATHHCWRVLDEVDPASRLREPGGAMLPVRGRELELATLDQHWESVNRGCGRVVLLSGEAGVGKSYLADRFLRGHAMDEDTVVTLAGSELDQDNPFYPVAAYLRHRRRGATNRNGWTGWPGRCATCRPTATRRWRWSPASPGCRPTRRCCPT